MPFEEVTIGPCRLIRGDCLEVLPSLNGIDSVVTDPPYGIRYKSGKNSRNSISSTGKRFSIGIFGDDKEFDPTPFLTWPCVFSGAQYFYSRLPPGGSLHCWDKRGNYKPLDQADADMIWHSGKRASRVFHLAWRGICRHSENRERIVHPTQKPVALMEWCLSFVGGLTVLDPYMGSGTTGIACITSGRSFVGIEKDAGYFQVACRRIEKAWQEHRSQLPLEEHHAHTSV